MSRMEGEKLLNRSVYVIIQSFIEKLTVDQWKALIAAAPTNITRILVAEMTLSIIDTVTEAMMSNLGSVRRLKNVKDVVPGLEDLLQQSFCEALHMEHADESLKSLTKMIQQENQENLKSLKTSPEQSNINQHITPPSRLNRMVCCVNELLRKVGAKVMAVFQQAQDGEHVRKQDEALEDEAVGKSVTPDSIKEKIRKELSDISTHLMEDVSKDQFKGFEFVSSEEIESMGKEVTLLVSKEQEGKHSFKGLKNQLKLVFSKCFLRVWLCRLLTRLKKNHQQDMTVESCESIVDQLTPQLLNDLNGQDDNNAPLKVKSKYITGAKVLVLTQRLAPLLQSSSMIILNSNLKGPDEGNQFIPHAKCGIFNELRRQSWICTALMKWFLKTVVKGLGARLKQSILKEKPGVTITELSVSDSEAAKAAELSERPCATAISVQTDPVGTSVILETRRREGQQREPKSAEGTTSDGDEENQRPDTEVDINMSYVKTFIEKVVFHVCVDACVMFCNKQKAIDGTFEKVWAEVKNNNIYITAKSFKGLDREIHRCLCGTLKPLELLWLMTLQDPVVMELCVSLVKQSLMTPPQKSFLQRFLSSVGKFLRKCFS